MKLLLRWALNAVALMLARIHPRIDLRGVTVVAGNQTLEKTVRNALNVATAVGLKGVPVAAGMSRPMVREQVIAGDIHGESGLDGPVFGEPEVALDPRHAVDLIIEAFENGLVVEGLSFHVGSQCTNFENFVQALFDILPAQVGPLAGQTLVVGGDGRFHNRVAAISDINEAGLIDLGPDKVIPLCNQCKGSKNIQSSYCLCSTLDTDNLSSNLITDTGKQFKFQRIKLILSSKDQIFQIFQFLSDITLCIGKGLFADIVLRHEILEGVGNFQGIAEYTVIFDLQALNTGTFPLSCFQLR